MSGRRVMQGTFKTAYEKAIMADKPIGWWRMRESSGTVMLDSSGKGLHGVYTDVEAYQFPGPGGNPAIALGESGLGRVTALTIPANTPTTVEMWINMSYLGYGTNATYEIGSFNTATPANSAYLPYSDGNAYFDYGASGAIYRVNTTTQVAMDLDRWYHFVTVVDNGRQELWLDGVLVASGAGTSLLGAISDLTIASFKSNLGAIHNRKRYCECSIYDKALSGARINAHRNALLDQFIPARLSPAMWLRADNIQQTDGSIVTVWPDDTPFNRPAYATAPGREPIFKHNQINGKPIVRFSGLIAPGTQMLLGYWPVIPHTCFFVFKGSSIGVLDTAAGQANTMRFYPDDLLDYWDTNPYLTFNSSSAIVSALTVTGDLSTGVRNVAGRHNRFDPPLALVVNASPSPNNIAVVNPTIGTINGGSLFEGDIAEIIAFDRKLAKDEILSVERYLYNKYAIPSPIMTLAPVMWLDASDPTKLFSDTAGTVPAVANGPVAYWGDKSGNGWHATQGSGINQPLKSTFNGFPSLFFNGTQHFLYHQLNQPGGNTVFAVANKLSTTASPVNMLFQASNSTSPLTCYLAAKAYPNTNWGSVCNAGADWLPSEHDLTSVPAVLTVASSATQFILRHNKLAEVSYANAGYYGPDSTDRRSIGATLGYGEFLNGHIHEIIVLPYVATAAQREAVQDYLIAKWKIVVP